jgi:hypothetical protein
MNKSVMFKVSCWVSRSLRNCQHRRYLNWSIPKFLIVIFPLLNPIFKHTHALVDVSGEKRPSSTGPLWHNYFSRGTAISITHSEYVSVALVIQHAQRMRSIILSSVACLALT